MVRVIKIFLAILFFICLAELPYGYYQFVRFVALIGFAILAYHANERQNKIEMIFYICFAVLFQPLFKISLGRELWKIVDILAGIGLIVSIFIKNKPNHEN